RNQPFFKRYGGWFRKQLQCISWFFMQSEEAKELAESLRIKHFTITGDTRFDRVVSIREQRTTFPLIEQFAGDARIFLGGSTWEPDEALIFGLMKEDHPNLKFIIAPHEVHPSRIKDLEKSLQSTVHSPQSSITSSPPHHLTTSPVTLYSNLTPENAASTRIIIVDSIGILAHLYQYASISLIGGGFGAGIHNILEAAGFGNPVLFGPNYQKFTEARELIEAGGAFCVKTPADLERVVTSLLHDPESYSRVSSICKNYVENGQGATRRILQGIQTLGFIAPSRNNH
ncbi:MAG: 3-deoxy-D-manno-octulosonic acid transferase, partial [Bacteroidota bacterium]